jgi:hypothetical protein
MPYGSTRIYRIDESTVGAISESRSDARRGGTFGNRSRSEDRSYGVPGCSYRRSGFLRVLAIDTISGEIRRKIIRG